MGPCYCLTQEGTSVISSSIKELDYCRTELDLSRDWIEENKAISEKPQGWYNQTEWIIGGIAVGFTVGGLLGWAISR